MKKFVIATVAVLGLAGVAQAENPMVDGPDARVETRAAYSDRGFDGQVGYDVSSGQFAASNMTATSPVYGADNAQGLSDNYAGK